MLVDKALEIGLGDEVGRRMPDKVAAKLKFTHVFIFPSF
jgi:hypothetical protein